MLDFLKKMPKIELHAHLGGSCPKNRLLELLQQYEHHEKA
jgi:adenosine deaminase